MRTLKIIVCLFAVSAANAGPFGLEMGQKLEDIQHLTELKKVRSNLYSTPKLPDGHESFKRYDLVISPKYGLCKIIAATGPITTSAYGTELHQSFDGLRSPLREKYGDDKLYDAVRPGSIWSRPRDWMRGLEARERFLRSIWLALDAKTTANISDISLEARAVSDSVGYIMLTYEFTNFDACQSEMKAETNKSL